MVSMESFAEPVRKLVAAVVVVALLAACWLLWLAMTAPRPVLLGQFPAAAGQFPWMVATLTDSGEDFNCGGVLIDKQWVLSAKHCYQGFSPSDVSVRVGSADWDRGGEVVTVAQIQLHPDPNQDLALLQLAVPVDRSYVSIGAPADAYAQGTSAVTLGWGTQNQQDEDYRTNLRWTPQVITGDSNCGGGANGVFCAGRPDHLGSGTCDGDSGGPLLWSAGGYLDGAPQGTVYVLGTLRGLNNPSCYLPGHNDDWQSVDYGLSWIQSVVPSTRNAPTPASSSVG